MSDINRIPLSDDDVISVAGGNIHYVINGADVYCWGEHNPDVRYGFTSRRALDNYISANYDYLGEAGTIQGMLAEGIIFPL